MSAKNTPKGGVQIQMFSIQRSDIFLAQRSAFSVHRLLEF